MKKRLFLSLFFSLTMISCNTSSKHSFLYIEKVYDGDTFGDKGNTKYRLYGVDTPELHNQYKNFETTTGIEYIYAYDAMVFSANLILKRKVLVSHIGIDRYKRKIIRVKVNNDDLSYLLLREGLARVAYIDLNDNSTYFTNDFTYYKTLLVAQK